MTKVVERLVITNFLDIEHADIEIKSFNVLIGPQASGKSVIAKLLWFFKSFIDSENLYYLIELNWVKLEDSVVNYQKYLRSRFICGSKIS